MTTPGGLLRWGQAGRYSAWDDRMVITALSGRRTGVVAPARFGPSAGLSFIVDAGWIAVGDAGDGTTAVLTSPVPIQASISPGGAAERTDEIRAEIIDPEAATWLISVLPPAERGGVVLGWVRIPPGAVSSADAEFISREQDFSTGGAIPGPPGAAGPQGPPGSSTIIVGTFRNRTPADLLAEPVASGHIPADWDGPGNPARDLDVEVGWSLIWAADGSMWTYVSAGGVGGPWLSPGVVTGPPGERGPEGPAGPAGPPGAGLPAADQWHDMRPLLNGHSYPGGDEYPPQYRFNADHSMVEVIGTISVNLPNFNQNFYILPPAYRPDCNCSYAAVSLNGVPSAWTAGFPRTWIVKEGGISLGGYNAGMVGGSVRIFGSFPCANPAAPPIRPTEEERAQA
jgi:hypothetical protein